jgi:DNA-binding MarR family transcriptional regulator
MRRWQFKILLALRRRGTPYTASPSELADWLGLTRGALSARLRPLEEDGLIGRTVEAADRRGVQVSLTPAG